MSFSIYSTCAQSDPLPQIAKCALQDIGILHLHRARPCMTTRALSCSSQPTASRAFTALHDKLPRLHHHCLVQPWAVDVRSVVSPVHTLSRRSPPQHPPISPILRTPTSVASETLHHFPFVQTSGVYIASLPPPNHQIFSPSPFSSSDSPDTRIPPFFGLITSHTPLHSPIMPSIIRNYSTSHGSGHSSGSGSTSSHESSGQSSEVDAAAWSSRSTSPLSGSDSPCQPANRPAPSERPPPYAETRNEDLSPTTNCYPRASVDTYMSDTDSEDDPDTLLADAIDLTDDEDGAGHGHHHHAHVDYGIPPLPEYHPVVERNLNPTTPTTFAELFPSLHRMSIRHEASSLDGNMNLCIYVTLPAGRRRRLTPFELFHLRMFDLAKREFSLRRYCRDSGREVCNSKLDFIDPSDSKKLKMALISRKAGDEPSLKHWGRTSDDSNHSMDMPADGRPGFHRSVTNALRSLGSMAVKPSIRRALTSRSLDHEQRPATSHSPYGSNHAESRLSASPTRPLMSSSTPSLFGRDKGRSARPPAPPKPTNTIKLEFSNYGRVDIERRGGGSGTGSASSGGHGHNHGHDNTRYEFDWWGHKYVWKRTTDKHLNAVNYHLLRNDKGEQAIAHIVPEMRSPTQVDADEEAGGWIPPYHMWISDASVLKDDDKKDHVAE